MEEDKVKNVIDIIKDMDTKDKLRLGICLTTSDWTYRTFGHNKYFIINFTMAKLMEMEQTERNKISLYLIN